MKETNRNHNVACENKPRKWKCMRNENGNQLIEKYQWNINKLKISMKRNAGAAQSMKAAQTSRENGEIAGEMAENINENEILAEMA